MKYYSAPVTSDMFNYAWKMQKIVISPHQYVLRLYFSFIYHSLSRTIFTYHTLCHLVCTSAPTHPQIAGGAVSVPAEGEDSHGLGVTVDEAQLAAAHQLYLTLPHGMYAGSCS